MRFMNDACLEEIVTCRTHAGKLRFMQEDMLEKHLQEICRKSARLCIFFYKKKNMFSHDVNIRVPQI